MSLYFALILAAAVALMLRFRYGSEVLPYAAAALMLILFLYCPTRFYDGLGGWAGVDASTVEGQLDQISEILSFGLLFAAAWIVGSRRRKGGAG